MKKRFIALMICILTLLPLSMGIYADNDEGAALADDIIEYYSHETESIVLTVKAEQSNWTDYLGEDPDEIDFSRMYQVFYLDLKDIVKAYESNGFFGANILDSYYWVVPNCELQSEVQVVRNDETQHGWDIRRGTGYMKAIQEAYPGVEFSIDAIYGNILEQYPETDKLSFKLIFDELNNIHLMYFMSGDTEYVVPYFSSKAISWAENREIYTAEEYIELLREHKAEETGYTSAAKKNVRTEIIYLNYIVIGTLIVLCIAFTAFVIVNKKKKS